MEKAYFRFRKMINYANRSLNHKFIQVLLCFYLAFLPGTILAGIYDADSKSSTDLTELNIRDLMEIEITTGSRKSQTIANTAAAAFVITQEDIRRSGVTSIAEALRMVPGLQVAKIDANKWAISSRGFNSRYSNKLLVLMDGRTLYSPLFSGVFWDIQDTLLEDIDRIEVIRGPGAALWGANAVNGVINIITKNTKDTTGSLISTGAGKEERGFINFRSGDTLGKNAHYRIFGKYSDRDESKFVSGHDAADDWDTCTLGFRTDWNPTAADSFMFEGNSYRVDAGQTITIESLTAPYSNTFNEVAKSDGVNFLSRWNRTLSNKSDIKLQIYYDRTRQQQPVLNITRDTYDLDFQHRFIPWEKHEIIWGLGYRIIDDDIESSFMISVDPASRTDDLLSVFIQDNITIVQDYLRLTLGTKFEHNDYSGFEFQPNIRALWTPDKQNSIWASFSKAVRTPSRVEHDSRTNLNVIPPGVFPNTSGLPMIVSTFSNDDFKSETLYAYEIGYRNQISETLSMDIAAFYNKYENLRSSDLDYTSAYSEDSPLPPHMVVPIILRNETQGHTYGIEASAEWKPLLWWKIKPAYSFLHMNLTESIGSSTVETLETSAPKHQFSFRSYMNLPMDLELDLWLRYVDDLRTFNIDSYCMIDARLGWKPTNNLELSIAGQNIFDSQHAEFKEDFMDFATTEVERTFYLKITWFF
ncbi:MAG: TonB-dependent receptor [Proteobacteria bacterium]|nr:TonB-dependent receptor [Pseudomonadota bacterium]